MKTKVKTVDVTAYEWFDRVNGNSYFAGTVTINLGMKTEKTFNVPYQYGYGDAYKFEAFRLLQEKNIIPDKSDSIFWRYYKDNNIIARHVKHEGCKKAELKRF